MQPGFGATSTSWCSSMCRSPSVIASAGSSRTRNSLPRRELHLLLCDERNVLQIYVPLYLCVRCTMSSSVLVPNTNPHMLTLSLSHTHLHSCTLTCTYSYLHFLSFFLSFSLSLSHTHTQHSPSHSGCLH